MSSAVQKLKTSLFLMGNGNLSSKQAASYTVRVNYIPT